METEDEMRPLVETAEDGLVSNEADSNQLGVVGTSPEDDDDEDECRVCRGPAEEGRPLYAPCKCSGSIGLVHQDCLTSWLAVTRKEGRCELCKTKFEFRPKYAEGAPDKLPAHEVLLGLFSRILAQWLPFTLRILLAAAMWLVVAPLLTIYLYHGWMHGPSSIVARWRLQLIPADIVSGIVVVLIILASFLGLMSFADFLRVHWHQQRNPEQNNDNMNARDAFNAAGREGLLPRQGPHVDELMFGNARGNDDENDDIAAEEVDEILNEHGVHVGVDDGIMDHLHGQQPQPQQDEESEDDDENDTVDNDGYVSLVRPGGGTTGHADDEQAEQNMAEHDEYVENVAEDDLEGDLNEGGNEDEVIPPLVEPPEPGDNDLFSDSDEDDDLPPPLLHDDDEMPPFAARGGDNNENDGRPDEGNMPAQAEEQRDADRIGPFDPLDPLFQDDQLDMEINVALDELLGLRGPFGVLIRNLLWLLAFNALFLGVFAFFPRTIGSFTYSGMLNTTFCGMIVDTIPFVASDDANKTTIRTIIGAVNEQSKIQEASFQLTDMFLMALGYFFIAFSVVLFKWIWSATRGNGDGQNENDQNVDMFIDMGENGQPDLDFFQRLDAQDMNGRDGMGDVVIVPIAFGVILDVSIAVVKVCILLFLKMMLLPFLLGVCLDASTIALLGNQVSERTNFAGGDLFSFALLHWVAGITFMLLVTVFLLQLREVGHPDVLARVIRPQEPQPDLMGNLMNETVATHVKRMIMSLGVYAPLLMIYVYAPAKLFLATGLGASFSHLHFWHPIMPQIQMPLELIMFHLSMLALLERYKNLIGELQHRWLVFICRRMALTEYLLPREIQMFKLVGVKSVFASSEEIEGEVSENDQSAATGGAVDPFWYKLASDDDGREKILTDLVSSIQCPQDLVVPGETKLNGTRVLSRTENYIRLPGLNDGAGLISSDIQLLPTRIGRFRLKRAQDHTDNSQVIQVWEELPGREIPRPPAGWDDLGIGGAYVQGRWAWGEEEMSIIERGVSHRSPFRSRKDGKFPTQLMLKLVLLAALSWAAITITAGGILVVPLAIGRALYSLFRVPTKYVHDPLAFYVGSCLFFPLLSLAAETYTATVGASTVRHHVTQWISRSNLPPTPKMIVMVKSLFLWSFAAPLALGVSYELLFVKGASWFDGDESGFGIISILLCWMVGAVLLNAWCFLAYYNVFTASFWTAIGNGILEPPIDGGDGAPQGAAAGNENNRQEGTGAHLGTVWQGKNGRVAQFFTRWYMVLSDWDWGLVDNTVFLEDFTLPISKRIISLLVLSVTVFQFWVYLAEAALLSGDGTMLVPFFGPLGRGIFRLLTFRICLVCNALAQIGSAFRSPLRRWFITAHKAARDDRYLIGQILINYPGRSGVSSVGVRP